MKAPYSKAPSCAVAVYIGSDFDHVITVSESIEDVKTAATNIADIRRATPTDLDFDNLNSKLNLTLADGTILDTALTSVGVDKATLDAAVKDINHDMRTDSASQFGLVYYQDWVIGLIIPNDAMKDRLAIWYNGQFYSIAVNAGFTSNDFEVDLANGKFIVGSGGLQVVAKGSITPRTLDDRFADVSNVQDFGAKGDGVTDDTAAFVKAKANNAGVFAPPPTTAYVVNTDIDGVFGYGKVSFSGSGKVDYLDLLTTATPTEFTKQRLVGAFPVGAHDGTYLKATYGYDYLFPQGMSYDADTDLLFINYYTHSGDNDWNWVDVYKYSTMLFIATFAAGSGFCEGAIVSSNRIAIHNNSLGVFEVYPLPVDISTINRTRLTPTITQTSKLGSQCSSYNEVVTVVASAPNTMVGSNYRSVLYTYDKEDFLTNITPKVRNLVYLPISQTGGNTTDASDEISKAQSHAFTSQGIWVVGNGNWTTNSPEQHPAGQDLAYKLYSPQGDMLKSYTLDPAIMNSINTAITRVEPEGIIEVNGKIVSLIVTNENTTLMNNVHLYEHSASEAIIDYTPALTVSGFSTIGQLGTSINAYPLGSDKGYMTSFNEIIAYMRKAGLGIYQFAQISGQKPLVVGNYTMVFGDVATIHWVDSTIFHIDIRTIDGIYRWVVTGTTYTQKKFVDGGLQITTGDTAVVQLPNSWGMISIYQPTDTFQRIQDYWNPDGRAGSITMTGSSVSYLSSVPVVSLQRGRAAQELTGATEKCIAAITGALVHTRGVATNIDALRSVMPEASPGDNLVDYAKVVPYLLAAIRELDGRLTKAGIN